MGIGLRQISGVRCLANSPDAYWEIQRAKGEARRLERAVVAQIKAESPDITDAALESALKAEFTAEFPDLDIYTRFVERGGVPNQPALLVTERWHKVPPNWWAEDPALDGPGIDGQGSISMPWTESDDGTFNDWDGTTTAGGGAIVADETSIVKGSTNSYNCTYGTSDSAYVYGTFSPAEATIWANSYWYFADAPDDSFFIIRWNEDGDASDYCILRLYADGSLKWGTDYAVTDTTYDLPSWDTWYWMSIKCAMVGGNWIVELWVDDVQKDSRTLGTGASSNLGEVRLGVQSSGQSTGSLYMDQCNMQATRKTEPSAAAGQPTMRRWKHVKHMPHTYSIGA